MIIQNCVYYKNSDNVNFLEESQTCSFLLQPVVFSILINRHTIKAEGKNVIDFVLPKAAA